MLIREKSPDTAKEGRGAEALQSPGRDALLTSVIYMWVRFCMIYAKLTAITSRAQGPVCVRLRT